MTDDYEKKIRIGEKILVASRDNLYFAMRFMDMALCAFTYHADEGNHFAGTDGNTIFYYPDFLMDNYQDNVKTVNRLYLHMTLHCIYRHIFRIEERDARLWNLACDVAVEAVIDKLMYPCIAMNIPAYRDSLYNTIKDEYKLITADTVYRYFTENPVPEVKLTILELQYKMDDHNYWYHKDDKNRQKSQQKWDDISQKMQTSMETIEKGIGKENNSLYQQITAENRKTYDYKDFLRKFSVYQEEMQTDPDSFDYCFYTYGLKMYGNMPLIEPLETREVKKIQDFVIAIDTSFSCSEEQVRRFLEETCQILFSTESFFKKVHIHVIQCDMKVNKDDLITSEQEMRDYINHLTISGRGGTDFRPVFQYVNELLEKGDFSNLRGLLYFTDGRGEYPKRMPPYDTAFIFLKEDYVDSNVPTWAIKLEI